MKWKRTKQGTYETEGNFMWEIYRSGKIWVAFSNCHSSMFFDRFKKAKQVAELIDEG